MGQYDSASRHPQSGERPRPGRGSAHTRRQLRLTVNRVEVGPPVLPHRPADQQQHPGRRHLRRLCSHPLSLLEHLITQRNAEPALPPHAESKIEEPTKYPCTKFQPQHRTHTPAKIHTYIQMMFKETVKSQQTYTPVSDECKIPKHATVARDIPCKRLPLTTSTTPKNRSPRTLRPATDARRKPPEPLENVLNSTLTGKKTEWWAGPDLNRRPPPPQKILYLVYSFLKELL